MLYAIGDFHLTGGAEKPMDVFGEKWADHQNKIVSGFSGLSSEDVCVICGDISWSMSLESSIPDFQFIDSLPGRKIILKGNHDFWWTTSAKLGKMFEENGIRTIDVLHNNCFFYGETALCGTRGWMFGENAAGAHDKKILARELIRLETSLKAAGDCPEKICFLHYPPIFNGIVCQEIVELMNKYGVSKCYYGHIHGNGHKYAVQGKISGVEYYLISADYLNFTPLKIK